MPLNESPEAPAAPPPQPGPPVPADYGDVRAEFAALESGCGVYALSGRVKIKLTGSDQVRWLNGMITNNVRDLAADHGIYAFLLNPQGRILGDLYAYNRGASLLLDTDRSQLEKLLAIFDKYIIMDDVEVANITDQLSAIGIAGPKVRTVLLAAGIGLPELKPLQCVDILWRNIKLTLVRGDHPGVEAYEVWIGPENVAPIWDALVTAGASPVGASALEFLRVATGVPRYGQDIRDRDLPQETSQDRALHFAKGCYVGQEIVERIRSRGAVHRQLAGFEIHSFDNAMGLPAPGTKVQVEGKDVGEITSVASLPAADGVRPVALGYIRREFGTVGQQLDASGAKLTVARLPFIKL